MPDPDDSQALPHGDTGAVSFGPKHEDPSMPDPDDSQALPHGDTGAVSFGPKHEDPSMPAPDTNVSIGPKPEDPLARDDATTSTVVGPGGGGPGDVGNVGSLSTVGGPGSGGGGDVGDASAADEGPSTLLGDDGSTGFDTDMMPADLGDVAGLSDLGADSALEP